MSTRRWPWPRSAIPRASIAKARQGDLVNFTGIDSPYEEPEAPDLRIDTTDDTPADGARQLVELLEQAGRLAPPPQK